MDSLPTPTPLRVEYQNTVEDWTTLRKSLSAGEKFWVRLGPVLILEALVIACSLPGAILLLTVGEVGALLVGLGCILLLNVLLFLAMRWPGPPDPKILRRTTLVLNPDYLEVFNDRGWERRDWRAISRVRATEELCVLHRDDQLMYAVPHRAFPSAESRRAFLDAAERFHARAKDRPREDRPAAWQDAAGPPAVEAADTLQVRFSTSARDLIVLSSAMVLQPVDESPQKKPARSAGPFSWLLLVGVAAVIILVTGTGERLPTAGFAAFFVFLLLSILMIFPVWRLLRFFTSRSVKQAPRLTQTVTISPDGISLWAPGVETRTAWETLDAVQQNDQVIVFSANRPTTIHVYVIPKSAFPDADAARQFAETAARYRRAAAERVEEQEFAETPRVETGNPYQPPQTR